MNPLALLGRQGGRAVAGVVLLAILTPPVGEVLRPYVGPAVAALLTLAFLRLDPNRLRTIFARPMLLLAAIGWTALVLPAALVLGASVLPSPDLTQAVALQALAPPVMAGPAFALLLGRDATFVLVLLTGATALTPLTAPAMAALLAVPLPVDIAALTLRLLSLIAVCAALGLGGRWAIGRPRMDRNADAFDGLNVIVMFVFASAVMGDLLPALFDTPLRLIAITALAFAVFWSLYGITRLAFAGSPYGPEIALTIANRNMGLMVTATGAALLPDGWLYFAAVQFPIYLTPLMLGGLRSKQD